MRSWTTGGCSRLRARCERMLRTVKPVCAASASIVRGWSAGIPPLIDVTSFGVTVYAVIMLVPGTVESAPAGGAAATQVLIGGLVSAVVMTTVVVIGLGHRSGRITILDRAAKPLTRLLALPGWALLPIAIALPAFAAAGFGFVWDVSIHIDQGRDTGPFGTPAHYFMLAGIYGFVAAGFIAMAMPRDEPARSWVRVAHGWHAPVSAVVMLGSGFFAMLGFPLDDLWHRMF